MLSIRVVCRGYFKLLSKLSSRVFECVGWIDADADGRGSDGDDAHCQIYHIFLYLKLMKNFPV